MALKSDVKFEEKLICCFKNDKNLVTILRCFNVFSVLPLQIFQVQTKISTIRPVFLDHLSAFFCIFSVGVFLDDHSRITGMQGKEERISLTPHYHFHPFHRQLDISRAVTAKSSPLHRSSSRIRTGDLWFPSASR